MVLKARGMGRAGYNLYQTNFTDASPTPFPLTGVSSATTRGSGRTMLALERGLRRLGCTYGWAAGPMARAQPHAFLCWVRRV